MLYFRVCSRNLKWLTVIFAFLITLKYLPSLLTKKFTDCQNGSRNLTTNFIWPPTLIRQDQTELKTIIIIISSARQNLMRRQLIRTTWASVKNHEGWDISHKFLVGAAPPYEIQPQIVQENLNVEPEICGDLIMGNFVDTYRNLILKTIMGYESVTLWWPNVTVVVKCDDDVVLNIFQLIKLLNHHPKYYTNSSNYYGDVNNKGVPLRYPWHRWYTSFEDYPGRKYPEYCSGWGYVTTVTTITKLLNELNCVKVKCSLEDIQLTGIVAESYNSKVEKREQIRRLKINGTWGFPVFLKGAPERLRGWYTSKREAYYSELRDPIFSVITHGTFFKKDFVGTWTKVKGKVNDLSPIF